MKVLVMNCGSSSLKYQLIDMENESVLAKGICERIGADGSVLTHKPTGKDKYVVEQAMPDHGVAVQLVLDALQDKEHGVIESADEITAIGHRVLHAGTIYSDATLVTEDVKKVVRDCFDLGPLHNPANLIGIEACEKAMPGKPNVAVFDTAFGMNIPKKAAMYAIPYEYYEKYSIRRYGFHGTSHMFVSGETVKLLGKEDAKVIVCHIGNGASISASIGGKCVDTSMGLTPLEGLVMGTRSGDVDPAVLMTEPKKNIVAKAPGMKYRHYAPRGQLTIIEGKEEAVIQKINEIVLQKEQEGCNVAVIATEESKDRYHCKQIFSIGSRKSEGSIAAGVYDILRRMDAIGAEYIYTESFAQDHLGQAIMNRMIKAAGYHKIEV